MGISRLWGEHGRCQLGLEKSGMEDPSRSSLGPAPSPAVIREKRVYGSVGFREEAGGVVLSPLGLVFAVRTAVPSTPPVTFALAMAAATARLPERPATALSCAASALQPGSVGSRSSGGRCGPRAPVPSRDPRGPAESAPRPFSARAYPAPPGCEPRPPHGTLPAARPPATYQSSAAKPLH